MPPLLESNWQLGKSMMECNRHMWETRTASDVKFQLSSPEGAVVYVPAHKYVLISRSPVFSAMLCGSLAESSDTINITDVTPSGFEALLRYMYCDDVELSIETAFEVLFAAKKYLVPTLEQKCQLYIEAELRAENACSMLEQALLMSEDELTFRCNQFIEDKTVAVMQSESFLSISRHTLSYILDSDNFNAAEIDVFNAVLRWAEERCKEQGLSATSQNLRNVLGTILFMIRFPAMPLKDFSNMATRTNILTPTEECCIFRYFTADDKPVDMQFSTEPRDRTRGPHKFYIKYKGGLHRVNSAPDTPVYLDLQTEKSLRIHQIGLLGRMSGTVTVKQSNQEHQCVVSALSNITSVEYAQEVNIMPGAFRIEFRSVTSLPGSPTKLLGLRPKLKCDNQWVHLKMYDSSEMTVFTNFVASVIL